MDIDDLLDDAEELASACAPTAAIRDADCDDEHSNAEATDLMREVDAERVRADRRRKVAVAVHHAAIGMSIEKADAVASAAGQDPNSGADRGTDGREPKRAKASKVAEVSGAHSRVLDSLDTTLDAAEMLSHQESSCKADMVGSSSHRTECMRAGDYARCIYAREYERASRFSASGHS